MVGLPALHGLVNDKKECKKRASHSLLPITVRAHGLLATNLGLATRTFIDTNFESRMFQKYPILRLPMTLSPIYAKTITVAPLSLGDGKHFTLPKSEKNHFEFY